MPLAPKSKAGSWTATMDRQGCRGQWWGDVASRDTLQTPRRNELEETWVPLTLTRSWRKDPGSEDGRAGPEPQSPGPWLASQAPPAPAYLVLPPHLCLTDYSSLSSGVSGSAKAAACLPVPWDGLYTCAKSREPVLQTPLQNIQHHEWWLFVDWWWTWVFCLSFMANSGTFPRAPEHSLDLPR